MTLEERRQEEENMRDFLTQEVDLTVVEED